MRTAIGEPVLSVFLLGILEREHRDIFQAGPFSLLR
jgi:hypothetical protein